MIERRRDMVHRRFVLGAVVIALAMVMGATVASANSTSGSHRLTVVERATSDTVIDLGASGDSIGDLLAFGNDIYNASNTHTIGRDEGSCVRTNPGLAWECSLTTILARGSITVQGPFYDDLRDAKWSITGGTGRYRNSRGEMTLHARNATGTEFDFIFRIIG
jgi:hypothetical protein